MVAAATCGHTAACGRYLSSTNVWFRSNEYEYLSLAPTQRTVTHCIDFWHRFTKARRHRRRHADRKKGKEGCGERRGVKQWCERGMTVAPTGEWIAWENRSHFSPAHQCHVTLRPQWPTTPLNTVNPLSMHPQFLWCLRISSATPQILSGAVGTNETFNNISNWKNP